MKKQRYKNMFALLGVTMMLVSMLFLGISTLQNRAKLSPLSLWQAGEAIYFSGDRSRYVVLLQASDAVTNKKQSVERLLRYNGVTTISITLPSDSTIEEIQQGMDALQQEGILTLDNTILFSMGELGEQALRYGETAPTLAGMVISSPTAPQQESYFVQFPVVVMTTTADDRYTPQDATAYYNAVSGEKIMSTGFGFKAEKGNRYLEVVPEVYGSYRPYSRAYQDSFLRIAESAFQWELQPIPKPLYQLEQGAVFAILLGLLAFLLFFDWHRVPKAKNQSYRIVTLEVISPLSFFFARLVTLLGSMALVACWMLVAWMIPSIPLSTKLVFVLYLLVSGFLVILQYKRGKMPGMQGKFNMKNSMPANVGSQLYTMLLAAVTALPVLLFVFVGFVGFDLSLHAMVRAGFYALASFFSFYVFSYEGVIFADIKASSSRRLVYRCSIYLPLVLVAFLSIPIGYHTWMYQTVVYLFALGIMLALEKPIYLFTGSELSASITQSILFGIFLAMVLI